MSDPADELNALIDLVEAKRELDALRAKVAALADEWEQTAKVHKHWTNTTLLGYHDGCAGATQDCADELRALVLEPPK